MAKEDLKPIRTTERAKELGRLGGKASAAKRKKRKQMKEAVQIFLDLACQGNLKKNLKAMGVEDCDMTNQMALIAMAFSLAIGGDIKAMEFLRDTAGENPKHELEAKALSIEIGQQGEDVVEHPVIYLPDNGRGRK